MGDRLDKAIVEKRALVASLEDGLARAKLNLDIAKAELSAFEAAANLRPAGEAVRRKGRQPGAISTEWRDVLSIVYLVGPQTYQDIFNIAQMQRMETDLSNVRERVRTFVKTGLLEGDPDNGFSVTDSAAKRFGFNAPTEPSKLGPPPPDITAFD